MDEQNKKEYEISFLLTSAEAEKEFANTLTKLGVELFFQKPAASIALAYKIKRHASAFFGYYHFRATPDVITQIKETLNLAPNVLRFLIVTPPVKPMMEQSGDRVSRVEKKAAAPSSPILSNEALSEKLEEILK